MCGNRAAPQRQDTTPADIAARLGHERTGAARARARVMPRGFREPFTGRCTCVGFAAPAMNDKVCASFLHTQRAS